jgi:hypothetical protein
MTDYQKSVFMRVVIMVILGLVLTVFGVLVVGSPFGVQVEEEDSSVSDTINLLTCDNTSAFQCVDKPEGYRYLNQCVCVNGEGEGCNCVEN